MFRLLAGSCLYLYVILIVSAYQWRGGPLFLCLVGRTVDAYSSGTISCVEWVLVHVLGFILLCECVPDPLADLMLIFETIDPTRPCFPRLMLHCVHSYLMGALLMAFDAFSGFRCGGILSSYAGCEWCMGHSGSFGVVVLLYFPLLVTTSWLFIRLHVGARVWICQVCHDNFPCWSAGGFV
jgi:hypothetical protein